MLDELDFEEIIEFLRKASKGGDYFGIRGEGHHDNWLNPLVGEYGFTYLESKSILKTLIELGFFRVSRCQNGDPYLYLNYDD